MDDSMVRLQKLDVQKFGILLTWDSATIQDALSLTEKQLQGLCASGKMTCGPAPDLVQVFSDPARIGRNQSAKRLDGEDNGTSGGLKRNWLERCPHAIAASRMPNSIPLTCVTSYATVRENPRLKRLGARGARRQHCSHQT